MILHFVTEYNNLFGTCLQGKLPNAFYKIQDLEAQRFVGKCLADVSKRLPAHELLLDPFLASDDGEPEPMPISRSIPIQKIGLDESNEVVKEPISALGSNSKRSTKMIITGSRNPEDDAIYLKVRISDNQDGTPSNPLFHTWVPKLQLLCFFLFLFIVI